MQTKLHNIMSVFTGRDKKIKSLTIFCHMFDLKVSKGQAKAFSEPLVMTFRNSWNMGEVSVDLRQASTRLGTRLPGLNQGRCLSRGGEHLVTHRLVKGIFIPSSIQEELSKN